MSFNKKHTPGPWVARKDYRGVWLLDAHDGSAWVARTVPPLDLSSKKAMIDTEGDARLIAASPDLLDALKWAVKSRPDYWVGTYQYERALAAIEKATGEKV